MGMWKGERGIMGQGRDYDAWGDYEVEGGIILLGRGGRFRKNVSVCNIATFQRGNLTR